MRNYNKSIKVRIAMTVLCALIVVSFMPEMTYAFEEQQVQHEISADNDGLASVDTESESETLINTEPEVEKEDSVSAEPEAQAEALINAEPEEESEAPINAESETESEVLVSADPEPKAENLVSVEPEEVVLPDDMADNDTLLESYMDNRLTEELNRPKLRSRMLKAPSSTRRNKLNNNEKYIYDTLKAFIDGAAAGAESTAKISIDLSSVFGQYFITSGNYNVITRNKLGISSPVCIRSADGTWPFSDEAKTKLFDFSKIINALMADEPYAFYWYDKTEGLNYKIKGLTVDTSGNSSDAYFLKGTTPVLEVNFSVSKDYRAGNNKYLLDTVKTSATAQAVSNAAAIISAYKTAPDVEKLYSYRDEICALTSYNDAAAANSTYPYGDPWQMIYVFDDDKTTKVVCEGYAKAFQYLCDHTQFVYRHIECDSVTGILKVGNSSGGHMWNILHMDDGKNYIADITNSDSGMIGSKGGLFLSPAMKNGTVAAGYKYDVNRNGSADLAYIYDKDTRSLFSDAELVMAASAYIMPHVLPDAVYSWAKNGSSCAAKGTCKECGKNIQSKAVISKTVKIPATCNEMGVTTYTASFGSTGFKTQKKDIKDIPVSTVHSWDGGAIIQVAAEGVAGSKIFTCSKCGLTRTEVIPAIVYPTDLPNVKISKPKAGKKKMTVKWKKVSKKNRKKIQGIEIQIAADPGFTNIVKTAKGSKKKTSKVIKGLSRKTKYYVRIRAYKNAADGKHVSYWKTKTIKIK